jgi:hypothetical protein
VCLIKQDVCRLVKFSMPRITHDCLMHKQTGCSCPHVRAQCMGADEAWWHMGERFKTAHYPSTPITGSTKQKTTKLPSAKLQIPVYRRPVSIPVVVPQTILQPQTLPFVKRELHQNRQYLFTPNTIKTQDYVLTERRQRFRPWSRLKREGVSF